MTQPLKPALDLWDAPQQIHWRTSQRIVPLAGLELPRRLELARIEVAIGQHLIARRVWQLATIFVEGVIPQPQSRQVTDPSYFELLLAAGDAPRWQLVWRRFDTDEGAPTFPQDSAGPFRPLPDPVDGWSDTTKGNFLFPWGRDAEQRIEVPQLGALSLYVDLNEEAGDSLACVGGMLQGEQRTIIDTPDFWAWFSRR